MSKIGSAALGSWRCCTSLLYAHPLATCRCVRSLRSLTTEVVALGPPSDDPRNQNRDHAVADGLASLLTCAPLIVGVLVRLWQAGPVAVIDCCRPRVRVTVSPGPLGCPPWPLPAV
jgi:hypothetical protein